MRNDVKTLSITEYLSAMDQEIKRLRSMSGESARQMAEKRLIDAGILNRDGSSKEVICGTR